MIINMNGAKAPETPSPTLQEKTVTPETLPVVIGPDEGYDGLTQVTVNPDSQLKAENIRSGKTIFGVEGVFGGNDPTLVLTDIKKYDRKNVIMHVSINNANPLPCTVRVTSAELLPTQGYQYANTQNQSRQSFDYDNVSYTYGYYYIENKYQQCYGKVTMDVTIPETTLYGSIDAEYDSPVVTEAYLEKYLRNVFIYDDDGNMLASCILSKIPPEGTVIYSQKFYDVTTDSKSFRTTIAERTFNGLEFTVISTKFDPEKALTSTKGKIGDTYMILQKVVK